LKILYSIWPLVKNALIIQLIHFLLQTNLSISNPHERLSQFFLWFCLHGCHRSGSPFIQFFNFHSLYNSLIIR
jgi:hypothetical protein